MINEVIIFSAYNLFQGLLLQLNKRWDKSLFIMIAPGTRVSFQK